MPKLRRMLFSWAKGEVSGKVEGRPDLAAYPEAAHTAENWLLMRQGGMTRRPGTRFVSEVKDSTKDTILLPFEFSVDDTFIIETGDRYHRFYKNRKPILQSAGGAPVEIAHPYMANDLRTLHFTQSADVLFFFHLLYPQRRLSRVSDTNWSSSAIVYSPPPSFENDTDISQGATLTPGAVTGTGVIFTASSPVFLEGDVNRQIIVGAARATITAFGPSAGDVVSPNASVRVTILDDFPSTAVIPTGSWFLRISPQSTLDPNVGKPQGGTVTFTTDKPAFRAADVGKFLAIYGGLVKITAVAGPQNLTGTILSAMASTTLDDPAPAPAGAWTLEEASWSVAHGFPRTGEFFQGRLAVAGTQAQPTTWWLSASDSFDDYAIGAQANRAVEFTVASRKVNAIVWVTDEQALYLGTAGAEFKAVGGGTGNNPIGGDVVPLVTRETNQGSAPIQPMLVEPRLLFVDRTRKKIFTMQFDLQMYRDIALEITAISEHITGSGIRLGPAAFATRPDPRAYYVREDGTLLALTYFFTEKVIGFTRLVTNGSFEAVAVIPQSAGAPDQVWVIVRRTIGGQDRRFVEFFDDAVGETMHEPDVITPGPSLPWALGVDARSNVVFPAASVYVDDLTVYAFHRYNGSVINPMQYDVSTDGGATFPVMRPTTFNPTGNGDIVSTRKLVLANGTTRFLVLENDSHMLAYSDTVITLPSASTWTELAFTGSSVGAPIGMDVKGLTVLVFGTSGGASGARSWRSADGGATFGADTNIAAELVTTPFGYQVACSPGSGIWCFLNPNSGSIFRSTDDGVSWSLAPVKTIIAGHAGLDPVSAIFAVNATRLVAVFKGQMSVSNDAGLTWTDKQNLTLSNPVDIKQGGIACIASFGMVGGVEMLGGATNYATAFNSATTRGAMWRSADLGETWQLINAVGGGLVSTNPSTRVTAFAAQNGRGVIDIWNSGTTARNTWSMPFSNNNVVTGGPILDRWTWHNLQTDSAVVYEGSPATVVTGLSHLEGCTVDVVADGAYRGTAVVQYGQITLALPATKVEVGLHYDSTLVTMRPSVEGQVVEGLPRSWDSLWVRLLDSIGGTINGASIEYEPGAMDNVELFTGDRKVTGQGWDQEGRITIVQGEPYPLTILAAFGTLSLGDHD